MSAAAKYKRVLLKISGEMLCSPGSSGIEQAALRQVTAEIEPVIAAGVQVGLVVGGGNLARGRQLASNQDIGRVTADYIGMLATIMNALALRDTMDQRGLKATILSPIADPRVCEVFSQRRAVELLEAGQVVILAGGTGSPFFTTDTGAALRACEIGAAALLKATKVDGVYDSDPVKNPSAKKYNRLTYQKAIADRLGVMDMTAFSLCMEAGMPIIVFALGNKGSLTRAVAGEDVGTTIANEE